MSREPIGTILKRLRKEKNLSQPKLAKLSGVSREYISQIETGRTSSITMRKAEALAVGLGVSPNVFFPSGADAAYPPLSEKQKLSGVMEIPVYSEYPYHAGEGSVEPADFVYRREPRAASNHIEGYIVRGACLSPVVQDGDTIIVNRNLAIDNGDIVACMINGELHIARLKRYDNELWLENNLTKYPIKDCRASAVVIEVIRRLK